MGKCEVCEKKSNFVSTFLGVCRNCIIEKPERALEITEKRHKQSRNKFSLVYPVPSQGIDCDLCGNTCKINEDEAGFCGLKTNEKGNLITPRELVAEIYYDPHPTNCVPMRFCGASGIGYPKHSYTVGRESGYSNLSVFCLGCNYDCSFCQNWHYRDMVKTKESYKIKKQEFKALVHNRVSCVCFFGGDPSVQIEKIIEYCRYVEGKNKILRFCLETNGNFNHKLLKEFSEISLRSGGGIKFDLKFWNSDLNKAVTGVENRNSYECFRMLGDMHKERRAVPFLRASTLLIPGYISPDEVECIAKFISEVSHSIPYSLLAFYPRFEMKNLPPTSRKLAYECKSRASKYLEQVSIGNIKLLT